jgi:hypothetical protein
LSSSEGLRARLRRGYILGRLRGEHYKYRASEAIKKAEANPRVQKLEGQAKSFAAQARSALSKEAKRQFKQLTKSQRHRKVSRKRTRHYPTRKLKYRR